MRLDIPIVILLLLAVFYTAKADPCFDASYFQNHQQLSSEYQLWWQADLTMGTIMFGITTNTSGWVGLGISSNGGMKGAAIALLIQDPGSGSLVLQERFASTFAKPDLNSPMIHQNLTLICAHQDTAQQQTSFAFMRPLSLCEMDGIFDISINSTNNIIFAWGETQNFGYHGPQNRGSIVLSLVTPTPVPVVPDDVETMDVLMPLLTIPDNETNYYCTEIPWPKDQKYHVIQAEPILYFDGNVSLVHHMVAFACSGSTNNSTPYQCLMGVCNGSPMLLWAPGASTITFPEEAGFNAPDYIQLQIHYNNVQHLEGIQDASGFKIYYTSHLRPNDIGVTIMGPPHPYLSIPPKESAFEVSSECPSSCTDVTIPSEGITSFSVFLHMHLLGSAIWTQVIRNDTEIGNLTRQGYWDFNYQRFQDTGKMQLMPGDRLITHCVWNTESKTNVTVGGESTSTEMCYAIMFYYPALPLWGACEDLSAIAPGVAVCMGAANDTALFTPNQPYHPLPQPEC